MLHDSALKYVNADWNTWYASMWVLLDGLSAQNIGVAWDRQMGFLYTLEQCIKVLGFGITGEMENILMLVSKLFKHAQYVRESVQEQETDMDIEVDDGDFQFRNVNKAQAIRTLCLQRLTGIQ